MEIVNQVRGEVSREPESKKGKLALQNQECLFPFISRFCRRASRLAARYWGPPLFCGLRCHVYRHVFAPKFTLVKAHASFGKREQRVIAPDADICAGVKLCTALTHDNVAANHFLAAELLHTKAPTF